MNILVVCHYGLYEDLSFSFVHNQIREYATMGHHVRVVIPNGVGKVGRGGGRIEKPLLVSKVDGVELFDLRYVTLSHYGETHFNTASAKAAVTLHWNRIFGDFRPDIIHAHTLGFDSEIGAWLKRKLGCPLVVTTHGSDTSIPYMQGRKVYLKALSERADVVVCVSSLLRRTLEDCGSAARMEVILNGFNTSYHAAETAKDPNGIIQVGALIAQKKTDVTIRAVASMQAQGKPMHLTVIGSGPECENLHKLCEKLDVADCVAFTGQVPNQQVHKHLAEATYFVMPSVREGFGIVYLEAMASGCVTIGTQGEGIADLIENGHNGFLVPAEDPDAIVKVIESCLNDPQWAKEIAERGRKDACSLTWPANAEKYVDLYHSLIK